MAIFYSYMLWSLSKNLLSLREEQKFQKQSEIFRFGIRFKIWIRNTERTCEPLHWNVVQNRNSYWESILNFRKQIETSALLWCFFYNLPWPIDRIFILLYNCNWLVFGGQKFQPRNPSIFFFLKIKNIA